MMPPAPGAGNPRDNLPSADAPHQGHHWYDMLAAAALIALCTAMGLFLLVVPWSGLWDANSYVLAMPALLSYWASPYVRGAVSMLGILNLVIALADAVRFRRFFEP
jgi:hypothetical protein